MVQTKDELFLGIRQYQTNQRKIEYLEGEIKKGMPTEVKILALSLMAELHKNMKWYNTAAKNYNIAADLAATFREKIDLYFKSGVMFLQVGEYFHADDNFRKVVVLATSEQKQVFQEKINNLYLQQAQNYEKARHYTKAIKAYTRALALKIPMQTILEIYDKLSFLYEKIGNPREAAQMKEHRDSIIKAEEERQKNLIDAE